MGPGGNESTTKTEHSGTKAVLFHRLVRSIGSRDNANENGSGLITAENIPYEVNNQSATSLSSRKSQKRKFDVRQRLKRLSHDLPLKLWTNSKSEPASPRVSSIEVENRSGNANDVPSNRHGKMLSMVDERVEDTQAEAILSTAKSESLSPATLAEHLRDLIDPLPFPSFSYPIKPPKLPARDKKGRPIPPQSSSPIRDQRLIELLSSATFMNGSRSEDEPRPSVWDILEEMGVPPHSFPEERVDGGSEDLPVDDQPEYTGTSAVMVYSPLIPTKDDIVELGELIPVSVEEEPIGDTPASSTSWTSMWPLSMIPGWPQYRIQAPVVEDPLRSSFSQDFIVRSNVITVDDSGRRLRLKTTSAWVPSTTKVSFQAMWWGYRLWLPPPVMAVLSDRTLEVSKRASLIATALAWFFNNLPVEIFPIQVRPAIFLMQRIVPYLGYIATFISWSWNSIKRYDVGYGVTLTATWLVPFALIPGSWHEKDVPKSPLQRSQAIPRTSRTTSPNLPAMNIPKDAPISLPSATNPTISQPIQPSQTETSPLQPSPLPMTGNSASTTPVIPDPRTGEAINFSIPALSVSPPWSFAKRIFAFSPTKTPAAGDSESSPGLVPIQILSAPMPRTPVQAGSELGEKLLQAPVLRPIPLPEYDTPQGKDDHPIDSRN